MQIWVDADACPNTVKDILFRAANRLAIPLVLVANQPMRLPASPNISSIQVESGFDKADTLIIERAATNDIVITADIPLAAEVIAKGAHVIEPRGERLTPDNIKPRLTMRNFMEDIRASGERTGGPPPLTNSDKQRFANALDKLLAKLL